MWEWVSLSDAAGDVHRALDTGGRNVRMPMRPDFISQVIFTPYGARMSSRRRVN